MNLPATFFCASLAFALRAFGEVQVTPDKPGGVYGVGEQIVFTIADPDHKPFVATYTFRRGQMSDIGHGVVEGVGDSKNQISVTLDQPGTVLLELKVKSGEAPEVRILRGALVAPDQIKAAGSAPDDFDSFWSSKLSELNAVPMNAVIESAPATSQPANPNKPIDYIRLTLDNIRGTKIHGQLARPASGGKFPALLIVQWAGVYPLEKAWVTDRAKEGWLALNINPHDLPIDNPPEFYRQQFEGPLKNYWAIGNDDRDASYYLRMYLSCYRAVDYLASRPDWDGKTLVVMGTSQGGMQSLMTAGLHPKITAAIACVPAGCDFLGEEVGRKSGWPQWTTQIEGKNAAAVREASRYYDVVNFASRIKCPVFIAPGLIDEVCPAEGVFAAANQIQSKKTMLIMVNSDHQGTNNSQQVYYETCFGKWLPALHDGKAPAD